MRKAIIQFCVLTGLVLMATAGAAQATGREPGRFGTAALGGNPSTGNSYRALHATGDAMPTGNPSGGLDGHSDPPTCHLPVRSTPRTVLQLTGRTEPPVLLKRWWIVARLLSGHPEPPI